MTNLEKAKQKHIGTKYFRLLITDIECTPEYNSGKNRNLAICQCDCGTTVNRIPIRKMRAGMIKSCGCYQSEMASKNIRKAHKSNTKYTPLMTMVHAIFRHYRRKHPGNITIAQFYTLSQLPCYYCGSEPTTICREIRIDAPNVKFIYNGLDRVDSSQPHNYENCVPCCQHCNFAKRKMTQIEFFTLIERIYLRHLKD